MKNHLRRPEVGTAIVGVIVIAAGAIAAWLLWEQFTSDWRAFQAWLLSALEAS